MSLSNEQTEKYYSELLKIAIIECDSLDKPVSMVFGCLDPGTERFDELLIEMKSTIAALLSQGKSVFDHTKYLDINFPNSPQEYDIKFDIFYAGLIKSGLISNFYIMHNYIYSKIARRELELARELNKEIIFIEQ